MIITGTLTRLDMGTTEIDLTEYQKSQDSSLQTTSKNIVSAINENQGNIEALDEKTTPKYCIATITTTPTISSNYYVPLDLISKINGDFSLQDGGIKIPSGVNHIRVSGSVFINSWPGGASYLWARIYRTRGTQNGPISGSINGSPSSYISGSVPSSIIDVQEGDIIKLMADSGSGGTIRGYTENTWLMVEKID